MKDEMKFGRVTLPTDDSFLDETLKIMKLWGADAVRDCDGTVLPKKIADYAEKVYSTYFVTRGDNEWAKNNAAECQHFYVMSEYTLATTDGMLEIDLLKGYFTQQIAPDFDANPYQYWQVIDRTNGRVLNDAEWKPLPKNNAVAVLKAQCMHEYTVGYLALTKWDSTQMYNYITNNWTREKQTPYDPRYPKTDAYIKEYLKNWISLHPDTTVIRFTTFLYHFTLLFNDVGKERYVDWFGYTATVSPKALDDFSNEYGYSLTAEDFVRGGTYNSPFCVPTKQYLDYMDFIQRFVTHQAKELVEITHQANKEAMMFLGDTWIGAEPYGKYFADIGLDAVVGSVGGGVTVRMLSDIKGVKYTEGRFLPYFFPDTFYEGGNPTVELNKNWLTARRALMRNPVDRIGYGGYLKLAAKFTDFIDRVQEIADEFRALYSVVKGTKPFSPLKVAVLNAWGHIRSWQCFMVAHELWYKQIYSYQGILESLSGLPVDVSFISFQDVLNGALEGIDVVINAGDALTAFSGGEHWKNEQVVSAVKAFIYHGGGFIGVGEPSAMPYGGRYFQLASALGVEREMGFTLSLDKYNLSPVSSHFITTDLSGCFDYGEQVNNVYALPQTTLIAVDNSNAVLTANDFGAGKCVYMAGLKYSHDNSRLLLRALFFAAGKEQQLYRYFSSNVMTECHYYPSKNLIAVINNSNNAEKTNLYDGKGQKTAITLKPMEIKWIKE